jgi:hypothetical protein
MSDTDAAPRPRTKLSVAVRPDLATWQKLNVVAFLLSGVAAAHPELIGDPYRDATGNEYLSLIGHPVLCLEADLLQLRLARSRAFNRGLTPGIYTEDMFQTMNDIDNRATIAGVESEKLNLVGLAAFGEARDVDKAMKGLKLHG